LNPAARRVVRRVTATGAIFATIYAAVFIAAYVDYRHHAGQWFADLGLVLLELPFVLTMRFLSGGAFNLTGQDTLSLLAGALFCAGLAWAVGFMLERLALALFRRARRRGRARPGA
jgi:hypothetical protein